MASTVDDKTLELMRRYWGVSMGTSGRARSAPALKSLHFGVYTGAITLQQLLVLPCKKREALVKEGPDIEVFLGDTHVRKRTSRILLLAFAPAVRRFPEVFNGQLVVCLPDKLFHVLAVKLAVLYMERCLLSPQVLELPWEIRGDVVDYILVSKLFGVIDMSAAAHTLDTSIMSRFQDRMARFKEIRDIWNREHTAQPSKYTKALADNIFTFHCVPPIELFGLQFDVGPLDTQEERVQRKLSEMASCLPGTPKVAYSRALQEISQLECFLEEPENVSLKLLVWTADTVMRTKLSEPKNWLQIQHENGMKILKVMERSG